jgi:cytochrome c5
MNRNIPLLLSSLYVIACSAGHDNAVPEEQAPTDARSPESSSISETFLSGPEAYDAACARCHKTGVDGAPMTGNRADWEGRSQNWQSVLMNHAKEGYFAMPAKGGQENMPESTVDAATEYMLKMTYPDRPSD